MVVAIVMVVAAILAIIITGPENLGQSKWVKIFPGIGQNGVAHKSQGELTEDEDYKSVFKLKFDLED